MSNSVEKVALLVMLDSACPSPCFTFENHLSKEKLPVETFKNILRLSAKVKPYPPELVFMIGDNPLEPSIANFLSDIGDNIICPIIPPKQQDTLGIPSSINQTVIARSLTELITNKENVGARPVILHVEQSELKVLAKSLFSMQKRLGHVILRPRNLHLYDQKDFQIYKEELIKIGTQIYREIASGGYFNVSIQEMRLGGNTPRCPAGNSSLTIGPDGLIYPCPAFYHAGQDNSIGSVSDMKNFSNFIQHQDKLCKACGDPLCRRCLLLESGVIRNEKQACQLYATENRAAYKVMEKVSCSGYLFEGLLTLKNRGVFDESTLEGVGLQSDGQICDVTYEEFTQALHDIYHATKALAKDSTLSDNQVSILYKKWQKLPGILPGSRKEIFRIRVYDIIEKLLRMKAVMELNHKHQTGNTTYTNHSNLPNVTTETTQDNQALSEHDFSVILELHERVLAWNELLNHISRWSQNSQTLPFSLGMDELAFVNRQLANARKDVKIWFNNQYWPSRAGWSWRIDFELGEAVAVQVSPEVLTDESNIDFTVREQAEHSEVMKLGGTDKEIIMRLHETQKALVDRYMRYLSSSSTTEPISEELSEIIRKLGAATHNLEKWFRGMAQEYNWPHGELGWKIGHEFDNVYVVGNITNNRF